MVRPVEDETTVNDSYSVTVPAPIRDEAGIEPGDKIKWTVDEEGNLRIEVVKERYGAFSDLDPVDIGRETDVTSDHDTVAVDGSFDGER